MVLATVIKQKLGNGGKRKLQNKYQHMQVDINYFENFCCYHLHFASHLTQSTYWFFIEQT